MEEIANDIGVDLHTESLLLRAEQLARLESDKLVDKVSWNYRKTVEDTTENEHSFIFHR